MMMLCELGARSTWFTYISALLARLFEVMHAHSKFNENKHYARRFLVSNFLFFSPSSLLSSSFWSPGNGNECWIADVYKGFGSFGFRIDDEIIFCTDICIFIGEWDHSYFAIKIVANGILLQMNFSIFFFFIFWSVRPIDFCLFECTRSKRTPHASIPTPQSYFSASRHFGSGIHSNHVVIFIYYCKWSVSLEGFACSFSTFQRFFLFSLPSTSSTSN